MKKTLYSIICIALMTFFIFGCEKKDSNDSIQQEVETEEMEEPIEGMENMTEEELNQELINRADEVEVVPDKK